MFFFKPAGYLWHYLTDTLANPTEDNARDNESSSKHLSWLELSNEIFFNILTHLDYRDIVRFSRVNKLTNDISRRYSSIFKNFQHSSISQLNKPYSDTTENFIDIHSFGNKEIITTEIDRILSKLSVWNLSNNQKPSVTTCIIEYPSFYEFFSMLRSIIMRNSYTKFAQSYDLELMLTPDSKHAIICYKVLFNDRKQNPRDYYFSSDRSVSHHDYRPQIDTSPEDYLTDSQFTHHIITIYDIETKNLMSLSIVKTGIIQICKKVLNNQVLMLADDAIIKFYQIPSCKLIKTCDLTEKLQSNFTNLYIHSIQHFDDTRFLLVAGEHSYNIYTGLSLYYLEINSNTLNFKLELVDEIKLTHKEIDDKIQQITGNSNNTPDHFPYEMYAIAIVDKEHFVYINKLTRKLTMKTCDGTLLKNVDLSSQIAGLITNMVKLDETKLAIESMGTVHIFDLQKNIIEASHIVIPKNSETYIDKMIVTESKDLVCLLGNKAIMMLDFTTTIGKSLSRQNDENKVSGILSTFKPW